MHRHHPRPPLFPYTTLFRSRHGHLQVRREPPDEPPDVGPSEEERRIGGELEAFARVPTHEAVGAVAHGGARSEEHTSELQSHSDLVCRLLLEKKKKKQKKSV